jgi:hypothetical protein
VYNHLEYTAQIIFIGNGHINQLKDGKHFDASFECQWHCDMKLQELSISGSSFETGCCFAGLSFVAPFENLFVTDTTTNLNMEEDLSLKDKALFFELVVT